MKIRKRGCTEHYVYTPLSSDVQATVVVCPGSILAQSVWDIWWTKWHWDTFSAVFCCRFHSTGAPLHGKTKNLIVFITRVAQ
jgi:hypothetical protein